MTFIFLLVRVILAAIPGLRKVPKWIPKFVFKPRPRATILTLAFFGMAIPPMVLLTLSDSLFLQGDFVVSRQLYQAGMAYLAINFVTIATAFAIFFTIYQRAVAMRIRNVQDRADSTLGMTVIKVKTKPTRTQTNNNNNNNNKN